MGWYLMGMWGDGWVFDGLVGTGWISQLTSSNKHMEYKHFITAAMTS